jgi:hypothetical protein
MTTSYAQVRKQRFVVPRENRSTLVLPSLDEAGALAAENRRHLGAVGYTVQGRSLADLSRHARAELLDAARAWTAGYRDVEMPGADPSGLFFLAGHQPELFHPGVWYKNFVLAELARRHGAAAINLVIDSDTLKSSSLGVPCCTLDDPHREAVLFDRPDASTPFEERPALDEALFCNFGRRVTKRIAALVPDPLIERYWPMVLERARHVNRVGYCLAQARHQLEGAWGLQTLEVPQSAVCDGEAFHWFLVHLIGHVERFRECYNRAVHEYRRANGIRNAAQPVPDLASDGHWLEAPLWIWSTEQPQRLRAFICRCGNDFVISNRAGRSIRLTIDPERDASDAVRRLMEWRQQGVKIRSRALVTTLWARLALSDLFLHGIGGAKYDQVTDRLMETFFNLPPPGIMVLSATLYLPIARAAGPIADIRTIHRQLRELTYHPETFLRETGSLDGNDAATALIAEKQRWIETPVTHDNAYPRWKALNRVNNDLQAWVAALRQQLLDQQAVSQRAQRHEKVLGSRDYGFCLFPEAYLQNFLGPLLPKRG